MKLWIDDIRPAPNRYVWCKSVNQAKRVLRRIIQRNGWKEV